MASVSSAIADFKCGMVQFRIGTTREEFDRTYFKVIQPSAIRAWRFKKNRAEIKAGIYEMDEIAKKYLDRAYMYSTEFLYYIKELFPKIHDEWYRW